jgi:hypothetical protein
MATRKDLYKEIREYLRGKHLSKDAIDAIIESLGDDINQGIMDRKAEVGYGTSCFNVQVGGKRVVEY